MIRALMFRVALLMPLGVAAFAAQQDGVLMRAMRDELARSMKHLQLEKLDRPYFIAYRVSEYDGAAAGARFGALVGSTRSHSRLLFVEMRVGDYKLDNTNFAHAGSGSMNATMLPLEDDYRELRRAIWLATDTAYKRAVEELARKRAALQNRNRTEEIPDFSQEEVAGAAEDAKPIPADAPRMEGLVRRLSRLFREMPDVNTAMVALTINNAHQYYVDSEGRSFARVRPWMSFFANAGTQAADGMSLDDSVTAFGRSMADLPAEKELERRIREMGRHLKDLRAAQPIESYNGPVLFEGAAGPEIVLHQFARNLLGGRRPISEGGASLPENPFLDKVGARVTSDALSIVDNPSMDLFDGKPLPLFARMDDDGIPAREVKLVEKGILKTLLTTRAPVRGIAKSTASHRGMMGPLPSNLVVTAADGIPETALRAKYLELLKSQNKEYGIVVRSFSRAMHPRLAYKLFPDGREELIRSVEITGMTVSAFKEITAASTEREVVTAPFLGAVGMANPSTGFNSANDRIATCIAPSLLFEDVTVRRISGEIPKPPVAPHPYFDK